MSHRIFILNSVYKYGSTGKICFELAKTLNENGDFAEVCYARKKQKPDKLSYYFSSFFSVVFHAFCARIFDTDGYHSKLATRRLIRHMDLKKDDIVIINNVHGYCFDLGNLFKTIKGVGCKTILVLHDSWLFTGHCAIPLSCSKWTSGCVSCPHKRWYPSSFIFSHAEKNYQLKQELLNSISDITIVTPSNYMNSKVSKSFLNNHRIITINNGIDNKIFKRKQSFFRKKYNLCDKKIILCITNIWSETKGLRDIIELEKKLSSNEIIVVVGKTNMKFKNKKIVHINQTNSLSELVDIYSACDVMFNSSQFDNYPTVNIEALSCGCPVIAYDSGGSSEIIDKRFSVPVGDIETVYRLIKKIFYENIDYEFPKEEDISKESMLSKYISLINESHNS